MSDDRWAATARRIAPALMGLGVILFMIGTCGGVMILREGTTGLVGEGERLPEESPEQVRGRLTAVGVLFGAAALGWLLARVGDVFRRPGPGRPSLARLAAELLLLAGAVGLAVGALVWCGPRAAAYETPEAYCRAGAAAAASGAVCLAAGLALLRGSGRPSGPAEPGRPGTGEAGGDSRTERSDTA